MSRAAAPHAPGLAVEVEVAGAEAVGDALRPAAAQERPHPRHQLGDRERLDDIIVGADRKAAHPLGFLAARRHHDDRQRAGVLARPQPAADFEARYAGQHPVEDDEVGRILGQPQLGLVAALDALDDIAFGLEIIGEQQREIGFVLDDENARRRNRACAAGLPARLDSCVAPRGLDVDVGLLPAARTFRQASAGR